METSFILTDLFLTISLGPMTNTKIEISILKIKLFFDFETITAIFQHLDH